MRQNLTMLATYRFTHIAGSVPEWSRWTRPQALRKLARIQRIYPLAVLHVYTDGQWMPVNEGTA